MSQLLGPDGRPTSSRLVGTPRSIKELPLMPPEVIIDWVAQAEHLLAQGTPLEVPAAIPQALLFGMIRTMQQGLEDRQMLERALGTLRFLTQTSVDDPEEHWCDIGDLAMALRQHLGSDPLPGEYPNPT